MGRNHKRRKAKQQDKKVYQTVSGLGTVGSLTPLSTVDQQDIQQDVPVQTSLSNVQETVSNVQETVSNVQETVSNVPEPVHNVPEHVHNVPEPVHNAPETVHNVQETVNNVQETVETVQESIQVVEEHFGVSSNIEEGFVCSIDVNKPIVASKGWIPSWVTWLWYGNK